MVLQFLCIAESSRYPEYDASVSFCGKKWLGEKDTMSNNSQEQILLTSWQKSCSLNVAAQCELVGLCVRRYVSDGASKNRRYKTLHCDDFLDDITTFWAELTTWPPILFCAFNPIWREVNSYDLAATDSCCSLAAPCLIAPGWRYRYLRWSKNAPLRYHRAIKTHKVTRWWSQIATLCFKFSGFDNLWGKV